jgi:hypothetical protein
MTKLLPDDFPKSLAIACGLGAASSSCSYAAVALALNFRKGANFTAAMAFQLASTNLVAELTIIIIVLMGWRLRLLNSGRGVDGRADGRAIQNGSATQTCCRSARTSGEGTER